MLPQMTTQSDLIAWEFALPSGLGIKRYGKFQGRFYSQFLPAGHEIPAIHPPKPISPHLYQLARKQPGASVIPSA